MSSHYFRFMLLTAHSGLRLFRLRQRGLRWPGKAITFEAEGLPPFKSAGQAQRFLSAHDQINNLFHLHRDHVTAAEHRASRTQKFKIWADICSVCWQ